MTSITQSTHLAPSGHLAHSAVRAKRTALARFVQAYADWQQRNRLALLDEHALRDIGLTRHQAMTEAERPIWNAPAQWLR